MLGAVVERLSTLGAESPQGASATSTKFGTTGSAVAKLSRDETLCNLGQHY